MVHPSLGSGDSHCTPVILLDEALQAGLHHAKPSCIRPLNQQGIALIAHDGKKQDMLEYAAHQLSFLSQFRTRLSTGTTGALLNGKAETTRLKGEYEGVKAWIELFTVQKVGCPKELEKRYRELSGLLGAGSTDSAYLRLRDQLEASAHRDSGPPWVEALNSGPEGGDLQVGEAILMGLCENVLFFEDPTVPHEHEVDIQLFERAARIPNQPARAQLYRDGVMCLHDKKSATTWAQIRTDAASRRRDGYVPMTLVTAFRRVFNVELVLATVPGGPATSEVEAPGVEASQGAEWQAIAEAAAWCLAAEITSRQESTKAQDGPTEPLRVTIMRGQGVRDVVSAVAGTVGPTIVKAAAGYDKLLEGQLRRIRDFDGLSDHERSVLRLIAKRKCLSKSYYRREGASRRDVTPSSWAVQEVCVAPMVGRVGLGAPLLEGDPLARELANAFRGGTVELPADAYVPHAQREPGTTSGSAMQEHWSETDVVLLSCDTAHEGGSRQLPYPRAVCDEMAQRGAVAEVGGIFLAENDGRFEEIFPRGYERQGMTVGQLRRVARGVDNQVSILVAGVQSRRLDSVFATLEFGLVSMLVTDLGFARELLRLYVASHGPATREKTTEIPNSPNRDVSTAVST